MNLDDDLARSGSSIAETLAKPSITARALRARRRRGRLLSATAVLAIASGVGVLAVPHGDPGGRVDVARDVPVPVVEPGAGASVIMAAGGEELGALTVGAPSASTDPVVARALEELLDDPVVARQLAAAGLAGERQDRAALLGDAGLVVETTIRSETLEAARRTVDQVDGDVSAAVVAIDPATGEIEALAGPVHVLHRQARGAFRPIVMAAALGDGVGEAEQIPAPAQYRSGVSPPWVVTNAGGVDHGTITLAEALALSASTPWAVLVDQGRLDPASVAATAEQLGISIDPDLRELPAFVLGVAEVNPLDLAGANNAFATDGWLVEPHLVDRVLDAQGQVLYDSGFSSREPVQALEPSVAQAVRRAMEHAVCCGTGTKALLGEGIEQIGATGTSGSGSQADAWFTGSTPTLTTVVWAGHMDPLDATGELTGGGLAAELWRSFVSSVPNATEGRFPVPVRTSSPPTTPGG